MNIDIFKGINIELFMAYQDFNKDVDEDKTSRINAAGIINITLENLWRDAYSAMSNGNLTTLNYKLDAIWALLGGDEKEDSEWATKFNKIDLEVHNTGSLSGKTTGFELIGDEKKTSRSLQYLLLRNKAIFLRRLQNKQGKGTAYHDEEYDDFD